MIKITCTVLKTWKNHAILMIMEKSCNTDDHGNNHGQLRNAIVENSMVTLQKLVEETIMQTLC